MVAQTGAERSLEPWAEMTPAEVDCDALAGELEASGRALPIRMLAKIALRTWGAEVRAPRRYAPGASYSVGETIRHGKQWARVTAVKRAENRKQGTFTVLTLTRADGSALSMAADVAGAPARDRLRRLPLPAAADKVAWAAVQAMVTRALEQDGRFSRLDGSDQTEWDLARKQVEAASGAGSTRDSLDTRVEQPCAEDGRVNRPVAVLGMVSLAAGTAFLLTALALWTLVCAMPIAAGDTATTAAVTAVIGGLLCFAPLGSVGGILAAVGWILWHSRRRATYPALRPMAKRRDT